MELATAAVDRAVNDVREAFRPCNLGTRKAFATLKERRDAIYLVKCQFERLHCTAVRGTDAANLCEITNALSLVYYRIGRYGMAIQILDHVWRTVWHERPAIEGLSQIAINRVRVSRFLQMQDLEASIFDAHRFLEDNRRYLENISMPPSGSLYDIQGSELVRQVLLSLNDGVITFDAVKVALESACSRDGPKSEIVVLASAMFAPWTIAVSRAQSVLDVQHRKLRNFVIADALDRSITIA